jgi:hypothetical protein
MQIKEFSQPVTSAKLNENMAKQFGIKLNLEQFTNVQLDDARNKLRTEISQFEMNESYDSVYDNTQYQKKKMFLDVINQEIAERSEQGITDTIDFQVPNKNFKMAALEGVSSQWITSARHRLSLGEDTHEDLINELLVRYDLDESTATRVVKNISWLINESEEDKAALIMASKDMVDRITGWLEDVAAMKAEQLLELLDSIRDQLGSDKSEAFSQAVKPALENLYSTLESSRTTLSQGVGILTGADMGSSMGSEMPMGGAPGEEAFPTGDDFGASEPAAGGDAAAGRAKRESIDYSRKLGMMLAQSKKK